MFDFETNSQNHASTSLLSISGGGLLGVIPAAMLTRFEALGQERYGSGYRLCDSFDSVAGTSTGAVIAAGIALGLRATDIANFYLKDVPVGFRRRAMAVPLWHDMFDGDLMEGFFERRSNGRRMMREQLECHLTILTKDMARGSSVVFTTQQGLTRPILGAEIRSDALPISRLLRASTAAPGLFAPVQIELDGVGPTKLVDGGFSLFNDPGFLLLRMAAASGARQMDLTALGTGSSRPVHRTAQHRHGPSILRILRALFGLIKEGEALTDGLMSELAAAQGAAVSYRRHDMSLTRDTFEALEFPVTRTELRAMRKFAGFAGKERLFDAACRLAEQTIEAPLPLAAGKQMLKSFNSSDGMGANCDMHKV